MEFETLQVQQDGRVLLVRVDDPPYNFMTGRMLTDFDRLTHVVEQDSTVGAVVVTGATPDRYITHFDIADILEAATSAGFTPPAGVVDRVLHGMSLASRVGAEDLLERTPLSGLLNVSRFTSLVVRMMRSPAVWIGAISGPCGGGGLEMSVCFDLRYASSSEETVFVLPELLIGLTTTVGAQRMVQLAGPSRAMEIMLEGRAYSAAEMESLGLISAVLEPGDLLEHALEKAHRFARRPRAVVQAQKRVFNEVASLPLEDSFRREAAVNAAGIANGIAPVALAEWVRRQSDGEGDSVFLTDPAPWVEGEAVDLNPSID